ncbi:hypothetical protein ABBQ38_013228 [Trebouxia sp. C0009 RCD-2024]
MQARLGEEADGAGRGIPEGTQAAVASHTPNSLSVSPAALKAPAACCHPESGPTKQHCASAAVRNLAHAHLPAPPARDKHSSIRAKLPAHNSADHAEPLGWSGDSQEAGQRGYVVGAGGTDILTQPSTSHQVVDDSCAVPVLGAAHTIHAIRPPSEESQSQGSIQKEQLKIEKKLRAVKRKLGAMEGGMVATQQSSQLAACACDKAHYKSLKRLRRELKQATQGRTCDAMSIKQQMANFKGTAGCPALQCSNISSLPAPSTPANGLLPASSNTQQRAQVMPAASTDVDVPPTQQPLVHTEALVTDQLSGGQCRSRSDELATMDVDTTPAPAPAASEATAPALKSHVNRVTATATGLHAASQDQLSTGQRVVRQSRGKGRPAGSQPYSTPANTLLPTCFQAASSALAAALTPPPQASFNHSTELSDLGEQHVVILYQPSAGCTSTEIATWVQCATHFALPPNTGAAGTNRRTLAHGGRDAVPAYSHITQNVYTRGVVKPQRLHEDEVPVCTCQRSALDGFAVPASLRRSSRHRAGEVISTEGLQRRQQQAKRAAHVYSMQLAPGLIIDARRKGNIARLINHSCSPNCETQKWTDAATGATRIGIFARQDIATDEELTYDYCFEHTGLATTDVSMYRCLCASRTCRGTFLRQGRCSETVKKGLEVIASWKTTQYD